MAQARLIATTAPRGDARLWSANPSKRAVERVWLLFTPVWGAVAAITMLSGAAERWGNVGLLVFGAALGAAAFVLPLLFRAPEDRQVPLVQSTAFKLSLSVAGFALCMNYTATPFFFDVLHMHYGFNSSWNIEHNPLFLYLLTITYFSTYAVLLLIAYRLTASFGPWARRSAFVLVPFAVAFLETLLNANPWMTSLFCYDDRTFALWFGTLSYGLAFVFALPMWLRVDERPARSVSTLSVLVYLGAAMYGYSLCLDVLRHAVAPHLTHVVEGANGLRDFGASCLVPPGS